MLSRLLSTSCIAFNVPAHDSACGAYVHYSRCCLTCSGNVVDLEATINVNGRVITGHVQL